MVRGHINHLSLAALSLAASDRNTDVEIVAQRLYRFGTRPHAPSHDRDFGPDDDPMAVLGLTIGGVARRRLAERYFPSTLAGWYSFARMPAVEQIVAACKLYVSPTPEALGDAFPVVVDELVRADVRSFKVGRGVLGVLRPDKIVAYFEDEAHMRRAARSLGRALRGCPVQGVPFTSDLESDGLTSWGVDPPPGAPDASWRAWITKRLAARLIAHQHSSPEARVSATLADMRCAGIDPDSWLPADGAFCESRA